jgi:hypothetical protein
MSTEAQREAGPRERIAANHIARHVLTVERILMGVLLVFFGLRGFLDALPAAALHESVTALGSTLMKAGCMFPVLKGTEVLLEVYVSGGTRKA